MSEQKNGDQPGDTSVDDTVEPEPKQARNGPTFTESPDPLAGVRKATGDAWKRTEGKTVSMRVYIGTIVGIIAVMLLARCGG